VPVAANASAMDAALGGAGPSTTILPTIVTGEPSAILSYAGQIAAKAAKLAGLLAALEQEREELAKVWSAGSASENVLSKLTKTFTTFNKIIDTANAAVDELGLAAAKITIAQAAYTVVVNAVNPVVAALISNPWTYGAGVALASVTTSLLKAFISALGAILNLIGNVKIIKLVLDLVAIAQTIHQLTSSGSGTDATATAAANAAIASTPVAAPAPVATVATPAGAAAATGTPGAAAPGATGTNPYAYRPAALDPNNGWVAVDPPATGTGTVPGGVTPGAAGTHDVTVTATKGDLQVTVTVPVDTGHEVNMDVNVASGSQTLHEHIDVAPDGSVTVG